MLTLVEATSPSSSLLQLKLLNASNGYVVKDIEGLDPVDAVITTSAIAQADGEQDQNSRRSLRNVTIKLGLEPDYIATTVQSLRSNLYNWFMPKSLISLAFYLDDELFVTTTGRVESMQNVMFSADPEVDISIVCYNPDFTAPESITIDLDTSDTTDTDTINYEGTSDAGVIFTLNIDRDLSDFTLYNTTPSNDLQQFEISGTFVSGDVVTIVSVPMMKSVTLTRDGIDSSILYWMLTSNWITLKKGANLFRAFADGDDIPCTLTYTPLFGAI